jgi:TetR/AcrR family transcriptional regulator, transcriptional repressor for nem operon
VRATRSEQKEHTRQRILAAAGRGFRRGGYGGIGVDGLAKEAGVTSGAFYVHFSSKADAFRAAARCSVSEVWAAIERLQAEQPTSWWAAFVRFYLGPKRLTDLAESCGLQSLAPEVARADAESKAAFQAELLRVAQVVVDGPAAPDAPRELGAALAALATLTGAVTLARAVHDQATADQLARSAEAQLLPSAKRRRPTKR